MLKAVGGFESAKSKILHRHHLYSVPCYSACSWVLTRASNCVKYFTYFLSIIFHNSPGGDIFLQTLKIKLRLCNKLRVTHVGTDQDEFEIKAFFPQTISWFSNTIAYKINITSFNLLLPSIHFLPFPSTHFTKKRSRLHCLFFVQLHVCEPFYSLIA